MFCREFIALPDLDTAVVPGIQNRDKNMENYENRARVFFHEMTHLDFFYELCLSAKDNRATCGRLNNTVQ